MKITVFFSNGNRASFDADKLVFVDAADLDATVLAAHPDWAIINRAAVSFFRVHPEGRDD